MMLRRPALLPCTPAGIIEMLGREGVEMRGARAFVVGRSNIVGRPVAELLLQRDATVTLCHSRTRDLAAVTREADILVAAIGRAGFIRGEHVKPGATVVDVGMNRLTDESEVRELFGDDAERRLEDAPRARLHARRRRAPGRGLARRRCAHARARRRRAAHVAMLMKNTLEAARGAASDERAKVTDS